MSFHEFLEGPAEVPPPAISRDLQDRVERDLNPSSWATFARLAGVHFFMGLLTLSFCPQFGIRVFGSGMGLMQYFMGLGDMGCGVCCGLIFLGGSLFLASLLLSPDHVRAIRKYRWLELGALASLSLGVFVMLRAEIVIGFALAWLAGSLIGGAVTLELGWVLRRRLHFSRAEDPR